MSEPHKPTSREDEYFHRLDLQRLEDYRAQKKLEENLRHCPSHDCHSTDLLVEDFHGIEVERCPSCDGIWLDKGELELLFQKEKSEKSMLEKVFGSFRGG